MRLRLVFYISISFLFGLLAGWGITKYMETPASRGQIIRQKGYSFINPILACEVADPKSFSELKPIENRVEDYLDDIKSSQKASEISVYFRLLNSGRWFSINEEEKYTPASLLKVIIMMGYFKAAEINPGLLQKAILYNGKMTNVDKLIEIMIEDSDNEALNTLLSNLDEATFKAIKGVYSDLNLPQPTIQDEINIDNMTVSSYALVFRVLYGSTYLNQIMSEKALKILSETKYKEGLVAGIPGSVLISHKFGIREIASKELHDCGIVYYPDHPYLLCIMTKGTDYAVLQRDIADISKLLYEEVVRFFEQ